jgi:hypothetical protein
MDSVTKLPFSVQELSLPGTAPQQVVGVLEAVGAYPDGSAIISGWACAANDPNPLETLITIGDMGYVRVAADQPQNSAGLPCTGNNHAFLVTVPAAYVLEHKGAVVTAQAAAGLYLDSLLSQPGDTLP